MADLTLARVTLRLNIQRGYNEAYIIHQLVADLFGDRDERGYLYRVVARAPREARVLVLSHDTPERGPARDWGATTAIETRPYDPMIRAHQPLDFELRINATRVVTQATGRKKRVDIWDAAFANESDQSPHEVYKGYLEAKLEGMAGVGDARVVERGMVKAARPGRPPIQFVATNLVGTLSVTDPERLLLGMADGFGRSKAFGCGLLCLSRVGSILPRRYPEMSIEG